MPGPPISIRNDVDNSGPPSNFEFVTQNVCGAGVIPPDPEARVGCGCRADFRRQVGCEYRACECLEDTAFDEDGKSVGFPYHGSGGKKDLLRKHYLERGHAIYECNELCTCASFCKSRLVQKGRTVPLEIFRTENRGWGLRCLLPLRRGQFVDTYRGEIITDVEADGREMAARENPNSLSKDSYLFSLDKFQGEPGTYGYIPDDQLYLIDGQFKGGPSRFINHSCDPNLGVFSVSYYRGNPKIYELAFFCLRDIEPWSELTFSYTNVGEDPPGNEQKKTKCLCGAADCVGYLW